MMTNDMVIPVFNIMNVNGYSIDIEGKLYTFVWAADIAREAGLTTMTKGRNNDCYATSCITEQPLYESIRWNTFNDYVNEVYPTLIKQRPELEYIIQLPIGANSYILCDLALIVLMHCKSQKAKQFQITLATIIMPMIQNMAINHYNRKIEELKNDRDYYRQFTDIDYLYSMTIIAKDFGLSGNMLKRILYKLQVIYISSNYDWEIYQQFAHLGYTQHRSYNGILRNYWTDYGRRFVVSIINQHGFIMGADNRVPTHSILTNEEIEEVKNIQNNDQ